MSSPPVKLFEDVRAGPETGFMTITQTDEETKYDYGPWRFHVVNSSSSKRFTRRRWAPMNSGTNYFWEFTPDSGFATVGSILSTDSSPPLGQLIVTVKNDPIYVRDPIQYKILWTDKGSGMDTNTMILEQVPPPGFVSMGDVVASLWRESCSASISKSDMMNALPSWAKTVELQSKCVNKNIVEPAFFAQNMPSSSLTRMYLKSYDCGNDVLFKHVSLFDTSVGLFRIGVWNITKRTSPDNAHFFMPIHPALILNCCMNSGLCGDVKKGGLCEKYMLAVCTAYKNKKFDLPACACINSTHTRPLCTDRICKNSNAYVLQNMQRTCEGVTCDVIMGDLNKADFDNVQFTQNCSSTTNSSTSSSTTPADTSSNSSNVTPVKPTPSSPTVPDSGDDSSSSSSSRAIVYVAAAAMALMLLLYFFLL